MGNDSIIINVVIDEKIFRRFALFDMLTVRRAWKPLLMFTLIMSAFALVCFVMRARAEGAVMLGCVLLAIGLGVPSIYVYSFFSSLKKQVQTYHLEKPRAVYALTLSQDPDGIAVMSANGEAARYEWNHLFGAYCDAGCVYLYVRKNKAFLLPDGQAQGGDIWSLCAGKLPPEKLRDHRGRKHD